MKKKNKHKSIFVFFKLYKTNSLFVRDLIFAFLLVAIPFFIISMVFYNNAQISLERQIEESNNANLLRCVEVVDTIIADTDTLAAYMSMDSNVNFFAWGGYGANSDSITANLRQLTLTRNYIDSFYIYSEPLNLLITPTTTMNITELKDTNMFDDYKNTENSLFASTVNLRLKNNKYPYFITITRPILSADKSKKSGAIIINISLEKLLNMLGAENGNDNFLVLDNNNTVVCANDYSMLGLEFKAEYKSDKSIYSDISKKNIVSLCPSKHYSGWGYALTLPINTYIDEFSSLFYNTKSVIFFVLLFGIMLAISIAAKSFGVIQSITAVFEKNGIYQNQNTKKIDELDFITSNILSQIEMNKSMRHELLEQYNELQKVQTAALQSQITPHFLRNTLEVINLKAFDLFQGKNQVSDMLVVLGRMINSFIESSDYLVSIQEEIEYSMTYIQLLNIRYEKSFNVQLQIDDRIKKYNMLKLSLQPIIENAVFHGIKNKPDGLIQITAKEYRDYLVINIDDNGTYLTDEEIEKINLSIANPSSNSESIGLYNVNKRISIVFGKEYMLKLSKSPLGGLKVSMSFPKC
ncbi:MAG: histidine kinase [Clostridia bacterium]|nr:histidine kinase [Clostridia bacterium]